MACLPPSIMSLPHFPSILDRDSPFKHFRQYPTTFATSSDYLQASFQDEFHQRPIMRLRHQPNKECVTLLFPHRFLPVSIGHSPYFRRSWSSRHSLCAHLTFVLHPRVTRRENNSLPIAAILSDSRTMRYSGCSSRNLATSPIVPSAARFVSSHRQNCPTIRLSFPGLCPWRPLSFVRSGSFRCWHSSPASS